MNRMREKHTNDEGVRRDEPSAFFRRREETVGRRFRNINGGVRKIGTSFA